MIRPRRPPAALLVAVALLAPIAATHVRAHESTGPQLAEMDRRIAREPGNAELWLRRGELHRIRREPGAAEADFARARALAPGMAAIDLCLGRLWLDLGAPERALPFLDHFLARTPGHVEGLVARARARSRRGEPGAAVEDWDEAIRRSLPAGIARPEWLLERADAVLAAAGAGGV